MKPQRDLDADLKDPSAKHLRLDPDYCESCQRFSKCDLRLTGNAHKCKAGRK